MSGARRLPKFKSEAQEASWVYRHQARLAEAFESAGRASRSKSRPPQVAIELSPADLDRSRRLASSARVGHETYLKRLLHKALREEAQRLSG